MRKTMKLRSSEIIYNQICYDARLDPNEYRIGYQTRFNGMKEIALTSFKPGLEIPWHRIWYFKTETGMQWDRKLGIDKLLEIKNSDKDIMKAKDILMLGVPEGKLVGMLLNIIKNHPKRFEPETLKNEITAILEHPESNLEHEFFGALAAELVKPKPPERRAEAAPYKIFGSGLEDGAIKQMHNAALLPVAFAGALMPDAHQGYGLPIGGVLATENAVIPYAVGVDIACRMKLSILDLPVDATLKRKFEDLKRALETETKFGTGATWQRPLEHEVLDEDWTVTKVTEKLFDKARAQLGTSGSGNHFVEFGIVTLSKPEMNLEPGNYLALLSHSGSRGSGATIAKHYSDLAMDFHRELPPELKHLAWLNMDSEAGQEYWAAMNLMGLYASANHALIHKKVIKAIGAKVLAGVENHHNFAWKETHFGKEVIVHRKGATPAGMGVLGMIPGSMATPGFVVRGKGNTDSLLSASHGAGRAMSRTKAKEQFTWKMVRPKLEEAGVTLLSAGIDENPFAYKDIEKVMAAQTELVHVIARFDPKIVKMADAGEIPED
jgi:tRNA-splicing ligase RtcB (3'-phosphate/5'-hydroxy nucleic acid ligase)